MFTFFLDSVMRASPPYSKNIYFGLPHYLSFMGAALYNVAFLMRNSVRNTSARRAICLEADICALASSDYDLEHNQSFSV